MRELFKPPCMPRKEVWAWLVSVGAEAGKKSTVQYYRDWLDFVGYDSSVHYIPQDMLYSVHDAMSMWLFELDEDDHKRIIKEEQWTKKHV